jgi:hypothetical protein
LSTRYNLAGFSDNKIIKAMSVGGSVRYASKGSIGFYGLGYTDNMDLTLPANRILALDPNRPIYSPSETYVDMFVTYSTKLFNDKVRARFQLNVKNLQESGGRAPGDRCVLRRKSSNLPHRRSASVCLVRFLRPLIRDEIVIVRGIAVILAGGGDFFVCRDRDRRDRGGSVGGPVSLLAAVG